MLASALNLETAAHWAFDVKDIIFGRLRNLIGIRQGNRIGSRRVILRQAHIGAELRIFVITIQDLVLGYLDRRLIRPSMDTRGETALIAIRFERQVDSALIRTIE